MKSTNISRKKQFQLFKIEDFEEIRNDFCYRGDIFKLKNKKDDKIYASKIFTSQDIFMEFISKSNISQIDYPTIMKYYGIIPYGSSYGIIMENLPSCIKKYIEHSYNGFIDEEWNLTNKFIIILGISLGMEYLHSNKVIHLNLKPSNIRLDSNFYPKITDIGSSQFELDLNPYKFVGTPLFMAPEVFIDNKYDGKKADVYSFGMILYSIIYDEIPFNDYNTTPFAIMKKFMEGERPELMDDIEFKSLNNLIRKCWDQNPYKRLNFYEITNILMEEKSKLIQSGTIDEKKINEFLEYCNDNKI